MPNTLHDDVSVCLVGDSMGRYGQFFPPDFKILSAGIRLFGPALTVRSAPGNNLWLHKAIYASAPGDVIVFDGGGDPNFGYWGEILTTAASHRKVGGLLMFGGVRDSVAISVARFPVVCVGPNPRQASKQAVPGALNVEIEVGSCTVRPGDLIVGDEDGALVVQKEHAVEVMATAAQRSQWEVAVLREVRLGTSTLDIFGASVTTSADS